jgi:nicotinamidase-related amidase
MSTSQGWAISLETVISKISKVLDTARSSKVPVIFLQNGWDAEYIEELFVRLKELYKLCSGRIFAIIGLEVTD